MILVQSGAQRPDQCQVCLWPSANLDIRAISSCLSTGYQTTRLPTCCRTLDITKSILVYSSHACSKNDHYKCLPSKKCLVTETCHVGRHSLLYQSYYISYYRHACNHLDVPNATSLQCTPYLFPASRCQVYTYNEPSKKRRDLNHGKQAN